MIKRMYYMNPAYSKRKQNPHISIRISTSNHKVISEIWDKFTEFLWQFLKSPERSEGGFKISKLERS